MELSTGGYNIQLEYRSKYNLQRLHIYSYEDYLFAPGYACFEFYGLFKR